MTPRREYTAADAFDAGPFVPMDGTRDDWVRALAAGRDAGLSDDELIGLSACAPNYGGERATRAALRSIKPGAVKAGTWFFLARQAGWKPRKDGEPPRVARPAPAPAARPVEPERRTHATLSDHGRRIWPESRPLAGTIGAEYLLARRCVIPPADGDLRFHPALQYPKLGATPEERAAQPDYCGPALVALVTDVVSGEPIGLHRTWICEDGTKANTPGPARLLLGGHRKAGGVIRLWPDEAVTTGLGIGEGIESCLSLAHAFRPAWSLIDAGNLRTLPVLPGIEALVIAQDNDPAGRAAAADCAVRWSAAGCTVALVSAAHDGADLNDITTKDAA
jgi:hypothetical protein